MLGETIGSYRILRPLGAGGMGTVYLAQHEVIGRLAAIKLLLPALSANQEMVGRMFNEARMTALIRHPGLVDIYDFGRLPSGSVYIVMEYLEGETLAALLARSRRLAPDLAGALASQIAAAVGAAHAKGIVHRDLKPDNIFLVADEQIDVGLRARVLDFGIAKLSAELSGGLLRTRTGSFMGTPLYMSPEQCRGAGAVDSRTDVYSLGCILFEMLTGHRPFQLEGMGEIIAAHLYTPPPVASRIEPTVPGWLDPLLLRLLAKDPAGRYQTMGEVTAALGRAPRQRASVAPGTVETPSVPPAPTTLGQTAGQRGAPSIVARRPRLFGLVIAAAGALAGGAGVLTLRGGDPAPVAKPQPPPPRPPPPAMIVRALPPPPDAGPTAAPPDAAVAPPRRRVVLRIRSAPEGAAVYLASGEQLGVTPLDYTAEAAEGTVSFDMKLPGYASRRLAMPADVDGERSVRLKKRTTDTVDPFEQ